MSRVVRGGNGVRAQITTYCAQWRRHLGLYEESCGGKLFKRMDRCEDVPMTKMLQLRKDVGLELFLMVVVSSGELAPHKFSDTASKQEPARETMKSGVNNAKICHIDRPAHSSEGR